MFTRREFLHFVVGGALGTVFSPLPWRIADEIVLFTQRWTCQAPPGKEQWTHALCQLCPSGCGLRVRKIDQRAVQVEGDPFHPINRGGLCPLGASSIQLLYGEKRRVKKPLKRGGAKGKGEWEEIEWKTALNILTKKLEELRENGQSHTLACIDGYDQGLMSHLIKRFCQAYGTPNYLKMPFFDQATLLAMELMQGHKGLVGFDIENADYILSFGSHLLGGFGGIRTQAAYGYLYEDPLKPKAKIVQIEPILSNTASKVGEWLPIKPATEAALALGLAHVIIKEGLYNYGFIYNLTEGFDVFKELVFKNYSPERVATITGVKAEDILRIAKEFAQAKRPLAIWGRGKGNIPSPLYEVMAIHVLNALVGNINNKGGVICFNDISESWWPELSLDSIAQEKLNIERLDGAGTDKYPLVGMTMLHRFALNLTKKPKYPINALLIFEANPCYSEPEFFADAIKKIPFIVAFSTFLDETAEQADLVLPVSFYLERWDGVTTPKGLQYPLFGISKPAVNSLYETRHPADVLLIVTKRINESMAQSFPWSDFKGLLKEVGQKIYDTQEGMLAETFSLTPWALAPHLNLGDDFNMMWGKLSRSVWFNPNIKKEDFKTRNGRFEFFSLKLSILKMMPLPHYEKLELKGDKKDYPLSLIPYELLMLTDGYIGSSPFMIKALPNFILEGNDLAVVLHPKTATKYNLVSGDMVLLKTPFGEAKVRVFLFEGIMPQVVGIPLGMGHWAYDEYLKKKGINAHQLLGYSEEKETGISSLIVTRANLVKI
jgi:anaerobic selenocysteine-containing dehydrogenase